MRSSSRSAAAVGGLALLCLSTVVAAQSASEPLRMASLAAGSIAGVVQDETGAPVPRAVVSAIGAKSVVAVTDGRGRFEMRTLSPGPYVVRVRLSGFAAPRAQIVEVRPSSRATSSLSLRRLGASKPTSAATTTASVSTPPVAIYPVLAAAVGVGEPAPVAPSADQPESQAPSTVPNDDDHGEVAWRLRHARRGILKDVTLPEGVEASDPPGFGGGRFPADVSAAPLRTATNLFGNLPLSGQLNLLAAGSVDAPQALFSSDSFSRNIAYVSLAAPVGDNADWTMRGAVTQGDIASWFVSGAYSTRGPSRNRYDVGASYSTQRYDGGNAAALRDVTDDSRNVGAVYGVDTFTMSPVMAVSFGARFSRYDYLPTVGLLSPRIELTITPSDKLRINARMSSQALAPGAEEFLPPSDLGMWLPPQRTFSPLVDGAPLQPERTDHIAVEAERDFAASAVSVRVFHQHVTDQLVTLFGLEQPSSPVPQLGHYFVGNAGEIDATGWGAGFRTILSPRIHGAIEYTLTRADWTRPDNAAFVVLVASGRPAVDRVQDISTSLEATVPETATRVLVMYRVSSSLSSSGGGRRQYDPRFDVQVHQSLPFMDFSSARWEMLLAVRNFFREGSSESSIYDELLVVRPPKRIVGGLTLRF